MIHTDGRPTIANAPRACAPAFKLDSECWEPDPERVLCQRQSADLTVVLLHVGNTTTVAIKNGDGPWAGATVPSEKALDAFNHPYVYVA